MDALVVSLSGETPAPVAEPGAEPGAEPATVPESKHKDYSVNLDNIARCARESHACPDKKRKPSLAKIIDGILERYDKQDISILVSQARVHPKLKSFIIDVVGEEEATDVALEEFGSASETAVDELVCFIQFVAEAAEDSKDGEQPPVAPCDGKVDCAPDLPLPPFPKEDEPWFFLRTFAKVT